MFRVLLLLLPPFCGTPSHFPFFEKRGEQKEEQASDGLNEGDQRSPTQAPRGAQDEPSGTVWRDSTYNTACNKHVHTRLVG